jgi:hypothetical protein
MPERGRDGSTLVALGFLVVLFALVAGSVITGAVHAG